MEQSFINGKVNLLIENYKALNEVKGSWQMGLIQHSCALAFTLKNKRISPRLVEERIELIKKNTGLFSNFRGYNMFYMATLLSFESNPESSFKMILDIYKELKSEKFWGDTYLPLTASIVYENREKMDYLTCISKMKIIYNYMRKKHPFLTSSDDYCNIALIAIHSKNLDEDLEYIEKCYEFLNENGFYKGNDLQALSQILLFSDDRTMLKCKKTIELKKAFKENDCKMNYYGYPIIGAISLLDYREDEIIEEIKNVSNKLKEEKGFGNWSLGKSNRVMISSAIVASIYADFIQNENNIGSITNNIFLNIVVAIQIACVMAATSAAIASSSSN
ncbi:TPA: DUF4003 domain-containing protein [Clostridioides difficile]|uniref:DUF4003 domain-containing protein n=1 Tax=Clostridioides difficile TaxID=1496 RepID=UPI000D1D620D|nr:DUF4003 domain-containing protein [Clostridioides difficile]UUC40783.1 DUF4003 domain-containing protein [Clostridioides difficile]VFC54287.1 Uncharacterised protein [Clostridioides difficile]VHX73349.1 Uncharacterised protein [Clostridioides difficile]VIF55148.1 Uncharacterised protein [Clostridioides difficile]VIF57515.1 Uncharacterised protein [Clostridioides difficile]